MQATLYNIMKSAASRELYLLKAPDEVCTHYRLQATDYRIQDTGTRAGSAVM